MLNENGEVALRTRNIISGGCQKSPLVCRWVVLAMSTRNWLRLMTYVTVWPAQAASDIKKKTAKQGTDATKQRGPQPATNLLTDATELTTSYLLACHPSRCARNKI
ncbi:hypothetical protein CBL_03326 [Carabus blaptoides fortunei]